jgi:hypothetical protein
MPELKAFMIVCCAFGKPQQGVRVLSRTSCFQALWRVTEYLYGNPYSSASFMFAWKIDFIPLSQSQQKVTERLSVSSCLSFSVTM